MCFFPKEITTGCPLKYSGPAPPERLQKSPNTDPTMLCIFATWELPALVEINGSPLPLPLGERRQMSSTGLGDSGKHHPEKYGVWQTQLRLAPQPGGAGDAPGSPGSGTLIPSCSRNNLLKSHTYWAESFLSRSLLLPLALYD